MNAFPWASASVLVPLLGAVVCGAVSKRRAMYAGCVTTVATVCIAAGLVWRFVSLGPYEELLGGWSAPLGIELHVDGFAALMVATTAAVGAFVTLFSVGYFRGSTRREGGAAGHHEGYFWALWLVVWSSLNGVFVSADLFNLYVCMELMGLGSVALVALAGVGAIRAGLRYLLVTLTGSLLYLLGVVLLYGRWGRVDLRGLSEVVEAAPSAEVALVLMTVGLCLKTALVPFHFWLPKAHANAPAPVSAVLSALVVKASFYVLVRLWLEVFGAVDTVRLGVAVAVLGGVAILWGSIQALRQRRLKMLVAYSTVAQIGYLFLMFAAVRLDETTAPMWEGGVFYAVAHACSKGAMFLAAGAVAASVGGDRLAGMRGRARTLWLPLAAFVLAGAGLVGIPPSGGYEAKHLLADGAVDAGLPIISAVAYGGGLLAAAYVGKVVYFAFSSPPESASSVDVRQIPIGMNVSAFGLALLSFVIGLWPELFAGVLET